MRSNGQEYISGVNDSLYFITSSYLSSYPLFVLVYVFFCLFTFHPHVEIILINKLHQDAELERRLQMLACVWKMESFL